MITRESIRDALLRAYRNKENEQKRIDTELVEAMTTAVMAAIEAGLIKQLESKE